MLPHYNPLSSSNNHGSNLSLTRFPYTRLMTRWALLIATIVVVLWLALPFLEDFGVARDRELSLPDFVWPGRRPTRPSPPPPPLSESEIEYQRVWALRKYEVREAFRHAWTGYNTRAFPFDEVAPVSGGRTSQYNGWGLTLFDSLDTMWVMGLKDEFRKAVDSVRTTHFNATMENHYAPFFETTIRYLGGLLSSYALSKEPLLLSLADELGQILLPVFLPSGLPAFSVGVENGKPDNTRSTILFAEAATCQLEFKYLAKITGKKEYYQKAEAVMDVFYKANVTDGLFQEYWLLDNGEPTGTHFTIGANADSGYEYLLKQWIQSGDVKALDQYIKSARGIISNLIYLTPNRSLMYAGDLSMGRLVHRMEHLSCFLGGLFTLGAEVIPDSIPSHPSIVLSEEERNLHKWAGEGLTRTCTHTYLDQKSGLGPDEVTMGVTGRKWIDEIAKWEKEKENGERRGGVPGLSSNRFSEDGEGNHIFADVVELPSEREYWNTWGNAYHLRPETVESIFYMYRTTHDPKWREWGYRIFKSLESHTKVKYGYSSVNGVDSETVYPLDYMPSWFLAETLKYLYLLFDDDSEITFDKWVFNTEAHPLPVFEWTEEEKRSFGVGKTRISIL
ncbi:glycoside hydrolase [Crepidotus variabilis]|uniref:alpha-1,2-Mannosidase n=1 Tax=Crepidotus variabilis TaxID=179855 RepID=A0A9P6EAW7_9AGAR|nr:glycoside hydrolase [Crepidotus variabilis]